MKKRSLFERVVASVLALMLAIPSSISNFAMTAKAAEQDNEDAMPVSVTLNWVDSEFKDGDAFHLVEEDATTNAVKMKVGYESQQVQEEGYGPGELIITVKGIGNVNRKKPIEALVGADKEGSSVKTRDWTYTWNKANDTYTFTNNEEIKGNSVFSGYFELVWEVNARESVHGYSQNGMQAVLYFPEGDSVSSNTLSFTNETKADTFDVHIEEHEMYSYEGLTKDIANPQDYVFVRYNLGVTEHQNSRGLKTTHYEFDPDVENIGSGAIVISPVITCVANGDGTYRVGLSTNRNMSDQYLFVAYPKKDGPADMYADKTVTASIKKYGAYHEGDDSGNTETQLLAEDRIDVPIRSDFDFTDIPGPIYDMVKDTYYDKNVSEEETQAKGGDIPGSKMRTGTTETFYLEGFINNPDGINYKFELVDDFLYIMKNNGSFRQLESSEYSITGLTIPGTSSLLNTNKVPIASDVSAVEVFIARNGEKIDTQNGEIAWSGFLRSGNQTVSLKEYDNVTAVAVVLHDITESISSYSIPVDVKFNVKDTSDLEFEEQDNLTTGQVVNTAFIKLYTKQGDESYSWFNDDFTEENYLDDTNLKLADKDIEIYGNYLDRERDNITFYVGEKNDYQAYTDLADVEADGSRFASKFTMGADFDFVEEDRPTKFSLYTILDESLSLAGYKTEEDIWDLMELSGLDMKESKLAAACTPEVITDYNDSGRTYIALHFDFGDTKVPQDSEIRATFKTRVDSNKIKNSYSIPARSAVIIDTPIAERPVGKMPDAGEWGDSAELFRDIDRDGDVKETLSYSFDSISNVYADSSQMQLTKYVKTTYSDGWEQLPDVPSEEYGGAYQYKLHLKNGKSKASHIIVKDILEVGQEMQWQGTFQSVDLSECEELGLSGVVYYSTKETPAEDLSSADWTTEKPDGVKAIAVDFGGSVLEEGQELNVIINMKAPEDTSLKNKVTENGFSASFTMIDAATGNVTGSTNLVSNFVRVKLTPPLKTVMISKTDEQSSESLAGAKFALIDKETGDVVAETVSNERGYATFRMIPADTTYILRETEAPAGYETVEDREVVMDGSGVRLMIADPRKTGHIEVYKVSSMGRDIPVEGAEYTLFNEEGTAVATAITNDRGLASFHGVAWGKYTVKETVSPAGYQLNETEYPVEITQENVSDVAFIDTTDIQDDVSVRLNKFAKKADGTETEEPVAGATFELVRKTAAGDKRVGLYVTDTEGRIDLVELPYGDYYFREYITPEGYITAANADFILSPENKDVSVTVYNQRNPGKITITKKDNLGNLVEGAQFGLFDRIYDEEELKDAVPAATATTDENGVATFENLEWGTHYIREIKAPKYYQMDPEWKTAVVRGSSLSITINVVNETVKGSVILTKTDEYSTPALKQFLAGAEYTLFKDDGTVIGTYTTASEETTLPDGTVLQVGQLIAQNLEWGSYYFKETKAPEGYGLSDETVRFSVNAMNAGSVQEIEVMDPLDAKSITLIKRIKAEDVNFDNGNPTFIFKVDGTDIHGEKHTYYRSVTFDKAYVNANTDSDGFVRLSVTIGDLVAGEYTATEQETSRYHLDSIIDPVNGTVDGDKVVFDLSTVDKDDASAVFTNRNYEQQDYSDTQIIMNVLKEKVKLTALKVTYGAEEVEAGSSVDENLLEVLAIYDDGSTKQLQKSDYTLSVEQFPNQNGDYTVTVTYEERGITRTGNFTVTLYGMSEIIVDLEVTPKSNAPVQPGSSITADMFDVYGVYNTGTKRLLTAGQDVITSPNWPNNYPDNMTESEFYWEKSYPGADYIEITFDPSCQTEGYVDHIYIYDEYGNCLHDLSDIWFAGTCYTVYGSYIRISMNSDGGVNYKGFSATVTPCKEGSPMTLETEYTVSPETAPDTDGQFDVTISLNLDAIPNAGNAVTKTVKMTAKYPTPVIKDEFRYDIPYEATKIVFTDDVAPNDAYLINLAEDGGDSVVGWLDGETFKISSQKSGLKVTANDGSFMFQSLENITSIDLTMLDTYGITDMSSMFDWCPMLESITFGEDFDTSQVTDMNNMFLACSGLTALDVSGFDTSQVTNMNGMFSGCSGLTSLDVSGFDTSQVTDMNGMFSGCSGLTSLDVSGFDTSQVTDMEYMFNGCSGLTSLDVSGFDTSQVTDMNGMFSDCSGLTSFDLRSFDTSQVTDMEYMFYSCYDVLTALARAQADADKLNAAHDNQWQFISAAPTVDLTIDAPDTVTVDIPDRVEGGITVLTLVPVGDKQFVTSFKVNGEKIEGDSFIAPLESGTVTITDVEIITMLYPDTITVEGKYPSYKLVPVDENLYVESFKINGEAYSGDTFEPPISDGNLAITDIIFTRTLTVESEHNPYPDLSGQWDLESGWNGKVYAEKTFEGADSLTVILDYETEEWSDYIYIFDGDGDWYDEWGNWIDYMQFTGSGTQKTITVPGNYVKLLFSTNSANNDYYGFKATIIPNIAVDLTVNNLASDLVTVNVPDVVIGGKTEVKLQAIESGKTVASFKLNGETITGDTFIAPSLGGTITISDVVLIDAVIIESDHNPYLNDQYNVTYGEATFDGADVLKVVLDYETEPNCDYVYLYDVNGNMVGQYSGDRATETIIVPGNYVRVEFYSDGSANEYYGFKASITPVMPIELTVDNQAADLVTVEIPDPVVGGSTEIKLVPIEDNKSIYSFKLNGETIEGNVFTAPNESGTVTISDVLFYEVVCPDNVKVNLPERIQPGVTEVTVSSLEAGMMVDSFSLNEQAVNGNTFIAPEGIRIFTISDVVLKEFTEIVIESEHNPYLNDQWNETYGEATFNGAAALKVELDYETESNCDYVYLYDVNGNMVGQYSGGRTTETIIVPGDYVRVDFYSDSSVNEFYGFKATVAPVMPIELTVDNQAADLVTVEIPDVIVGGTTELKVKSIVPGKSVASFKLDGVTIEGDTFIAPNESGTVTISDVVLMDAVIIESEHNPYPLDQYNVTYGEATFDGADSLNVILDYETESCDYVYLYDVNGNMVGQYSGGPATETIVVPGNYVRVEFSSDGSVNEFYGFKATITAN